MTRDLEALKELATAIERRSGIPVTTAVNVLYCAQTLGYSIAPPDHVAVPKEATQAALNKAVRELDTEEDWGDVYKFLINEMLTATAPTGGEDG